MQQTAEDLLSGKTEVSSPDMDSTLDSSVLTKSETSSHKYVYHFVKRLFDIISSFTMLVVLSPFILACLFIKWCEDRHNPVYVSDRVTKDGRVFRFYKIRSMLPEADRMKSELIDTGMNEADGPVFKIKDDPRMTRFGRWMRRWNVDELLQLLNVLRGDMSVVGPRPPLPEEVAKYTPEQMRRLSVKGGLLCLWQIQPNRHSMPFEEWIDYDFDYIERQSLSLDLKIIVKGAFMVFSGRSGD